MLCCMAYACNVIDNVLNKLEDHRQEIAEEKLQVIRLIAAEGLSRRPPAGPCRLFLGPGFRLGAR